MTNNVKIYRQPIRLYQVNAIRKLDNFISKHGILTDYTDFSYYPMNDESIYLTYGYSNDRVRVVQNRQQEGTFLNNGVLVLGWQDSNTLSELLLEILRPAKRSRPNEVFSRLTIEGNNEIHVTYARVQISYTERGRK